MEKFVERNAKTQMNLSDKIADSRSQWKRILLGQLTVPTTDTGALAEKAKTWKGKPVKGIRHISPVASAQGMSIFVIFQKC